MSDIVFPVKFVTTNTRLGFVDVKALGDKTPGSSDREGEPNNIYHSAIIAHGFAYEYIFDGGIVVTNEKTYVADNQPIWYDGEFETGKTHKEFESWVETNKEVVFTQETYHVADNNCSYFTQAAGEFLGVKEPEKHSSQREWMSRNRHIGVLIQGLLEASRILPNINLLEIGTENENSEANDN